MKDFWAFLLAIAGGDWKAIQGNLAAAVIWSVLALFFSWLALLFWRWPKRVWARVRANRALNRYRNNRIAEWSTDRYGAGDKLFTQLSLLLDRGQDEEVRWSKQKEKYEALADILKAHSGYPALVLLGDPGSGKSTLLRRMDLDTARTSRKAGTKGVFSYFISLRDYRGAPGGLPPEPMKWLSDKWAKDWKGKEPHLPDLEALLCRESYLLLDALNEMPLRAPADYQRLVDGWTAFIADMKVRFPKCRLVFSCRSLDYSASLSNPDIQVPHVEIERLGETTILKFLEHYAPENAEVLFGAIKDSEQQALYSTAYFLKMLCDHAGRTGQIPQDRSALFTAFVRELLRRELRKKNALIIAPGLLGTADLARMVALLEMANPPWASPYELPEKGLLFPQLALLAYGMQATSSAAGNSQVVVRHEKALELMAPALESGGALVPAGALIEAGCAMTILEHDRPKDTVQFLHQLMQEYFASRRLAVAPEPRRVQAPWLIAEISPKLEEVRASLNINEPLPMLDSTGWEETTLLAAPMSADRSTFIESLIGCNLPLAGRAAAQIAASEAQSNGAGPPSLLVELRKLIQSNLLERMGDPKSDLRARIVAGKALGELGDPRFASKMNAKGRYQYIVPPLISIPGGVYQIGSDEGFHKHEGMLHSITLDGFLLAKFPVTNAEWDCFMRAGGYDDEQWWDTRAAKQWRSGETTRAARDAQWRAFRLMLKENTDYVSRKLATGEISPKAAVDHYKAMNQSDEEFEATLAKDFNESLRKGEAHSRYTEPRRWRNRDFNNPLQPVVGICWFEAQAYCAWLCRQTGRPWRLPTEAEWEAAAHMGSTNDDRYPWGAEFDIARCNSFESHIRATTPVGVFPGGDTPAGLVDMSGNGYEWTSTKYDKEKYPYPYKKDDGRESLEDVQDPNKYAPRVLRGGSWYYSKDEARISFRLRFHPGYHNQSTGLRLALSE